MEENRHTSGRFSLPDRPLLIVSHGAPSHPVSQEIAVRDLAIRLNDLIPGADVRGATLAAPGALRRAVEGLDDPIVCPWFMSDGWFVGTHLPHRLRAAGLAQWQATPPLGLMPGIGKLMADRLRQDIAQPAQTHVILAAHGSPKSTRPRQATEAAAAALAREVTVKSIRPCYVDEPPAIRDVARVEGPGVVLPFFAARGGHVTGDLPEELDAAGFSGPVLDPVGMWEATPAFALANIMSLFPPLPA